MGDDGGGDVEEGRKGDYVRLVGRGGREEAGCLDGEGNEGDGGCTPRRARVRKWRGSWLKLVFPFPCLGMLAVVCVKWVWPYLMDNDITPVLNWETTTFNPPVLALLIVASLTIFPSLLIPSTPSMWIAGMTFGYGYGFLLCISGMSAGVSIPLLHWGWMDKYPKRASLIRSAGGGNWFHQFHSVTWIRILPFPDMIYNYRAVATNVKFGLYFSLVGVVPEIFVTIGILIKALADASHDRRGLSAPEIVFNILGFLLTVTATVVFTIFAKRWLKALQKEGEPWLE